MAMTADDMFDKYVSNLNGLGITFNHSASEGITKALFQAIIDEIVESATTETEVIGGSSSGTHQGNVTG